MRRIRMRLAGALLVTGLIVGVGGVPAAHGAVNCTPTGVTVAPSAQEHAIGETATLTATVTGSCGAVSGAVVTFGVVGGPNAGKTATPTSNATGKASFSYSSTVMGTDGVLVVVEPGGDAAPLFAGASVTWLAIQTGRAFAAASTGLVPLAPLDDTGPIATTADSTVGPICTIGAPPTPPVDLIKAGLVCTVVFTGYDATGSAARGALAIAAVATLQVEIPGLPKIYIQGAVAFSGTQCHGSRGLVDVAQIVVGDQALNIGPLLPTPNQTVDLGIVKLVLNEQIPIPGGLTVNAVHLTIPGLLDLVVSSATSDLHGCPPITAA